MNNSHIITNNNAFGMNFNKDNKLSNSYEEIDERLFDSYLTISDKSVSSSVENSTSEEEESDSSSQKTPSSVTHKAKNVSRKSTKSCKKEEESDKNNNKKSSASSVASQESTNGETEKKQKSLYKTELCRNWEETNHCRYGMKCQYAHGAADLREIDRHPKYKTQKCRTFHQTGACPYGSRCTFRHFNLPGDALEMKNLDKQEEEEKKEKEQQKQLQQQQKEQQQQQAQKMSRKEERPSVFSTDNQKVLQQHWFANNTNTSVPLFGLSDNSIPKRNMMMMNHLGNNNSFDPEDSLLPSNAESLLPHQLLFDLESPDEEEKPARCPLRNYVNLPSFSNFQVPYHSQQMQPQQQRNQHQHQQQEQCKTFFRPWLF